MEDQVREHLVEIGEGVFVEDDVLGIVARIQDYDPNLRVKYLNPALATWRDAPYLISEVCPDGVERPVFSVWNLDQTVLQRLWAADTRRHDLLTQVRKTNETARQLQQRRYEDKMEEAADMIVHALRSPKTTYTIKDDDKLITISDTKAYERPTKEL